MPAPIRLIVCDLDGVLTDGEARPLDLAFFGRLAALNRAARQDPRRPAVTLCTGRPAPYAEALLQAIDGHVPAVFENGAGLYLPQGYRFLPHPALGDLAPIQAARQRIEATLVRQQGASIQPGKEYSLSIFAADPADTNQLRAWATAALNSLAETVELVYSSSCLNVVPRGIDKGQGLRFLAAQAGYRLDEMLAIGDSDVDVPFLALAGYSAAPANANEAVKQLVAYVAPRPAAAGVADILAHYGLG
ncbi:MAG: HAD family hydrolase [Candidatus Promineifilaceae bacterium]